MIQKFHKGDQVTCIRGNVSSNIPETITGNIYTITATSSYSDWIQLKETDRSRPLFKFDPVSHCFN